MNAPQWITTQEVNARIVQRMQQEQRDYDALRRNDTLTKFFCDTILFAFTSMTERDVWYHNMGIIECVLFVFTNRNSK